MIYLEYIEAFRRYPKLRSCVEQCQNELEGIDPLIIYVMLYQMRKSNTDTFRGDFLSMDEVQAVFKKYKPQLMTILLILCTNPLQYSYASTRSKFQANGAIYGWSKMVAVTNVKLDCIKNLVTRKSDVPNDMPIRISK